MFNFTLHLFYCEDEIFLIGNVTVKIVYIIWAFIQVGN